MNYITFDIEANALPYEATKLHVLCYAGEDGQVYHTTDREHIASLFNTPDTLFVCHNSVTVDKVFLSKFFGIEVHRSKFVDSLAVSWYLYPKRPKHGLASWGEEFGVPKPEIDNWDSLTYEQYVHRCSEDVRINQLLWAQQQKLLLEIYGSEGEFLKLVSYLSFKMDCLREQEAVGWQLDYDMAVYHRDTLEGITHQKNLELIDVMPKIPQRSVKSKPAKMYKKDGNISKMGQRWLDLCTETGSCPQMARTIEVVTEHKDGNPNSHQQVKNWLVGLGWVPCTFDFKRDEKGKRQIPQVRFEGELTPSVLRLIESNPAVEVLDGLTVAQHRKAIFQGLIDCAKLQPDGTYRVAAGSAGLTNTLRFKHRKPLVNLPGVEKPWGKEIRGVLIGHLVGCDLVSLEDTTKRHYMMPHDPIYVAEQQQKGYDPHLSLALFAGKINKQQYDTYKGQPDLKTIRTKFKTTNYSATYGIGAAGLSNRGGMEKKEAKDLLDAFWKKNWSITKIAELTVTKKVGKEMWLYNPVSGFWYSLRNKKDRFSTLNQGTGVYVFDTFLAYCRSMGMTSIGQFHDEFIGINYDEAHTKNILAEATKMMNAFLQLNVPIECDFEFGTTYAQVH